MREVERMVLLQVIDRKWREHLYEMDYLQEGITLRAYAQRDPVVEYQREGFDMFATMMDGIKEETVGFLFNLDVKVEHGEQGDDQAPAQSSGPAPMPLREDPPVEIRAKGLGQAPRTQGLQYSAPTIDGGAPATGGVAVERPQQQAPALGVGGSPTAAAPPRRPAAQAQSAGAGNAPSRNAPCPCGSGRKYKRCHGAPGGGA
jgi:preprotein translocase subunit SecA